MIAHFGANSNLSGLYIIAANPDEPSQGPQGPCGIPGTRGVRVSLRADAAARRALDARVQPAAPRGSRGPHVAGLLRQAAHAPVRAARHPAPRAVSLFLGD